MGPIAGAAAADGGSGAALERFLGSVRRRCVRADLLRAALAAAVVNESVRWASVGFIELTGREIPIFDVGPLFLLALYPVLRRRWTPDAAARQADERGALRDRLVTWLDFGRRDDVPAAFCNAQADEAALAVGTLTPAAVAPLPRRLAAGPLLLAASVLYPFLFLAHTGPETLTVRVAQRLVPGGGLHQRGPGRGEPGDGIPGNATRQSATRRQPPPAAPEDRKAAAPADRNAQGNGSTGDAPAPQGRGPETARPARDRPPESHTDRGREQPSAIVSERVGTSLAKLVDPVYTPGGRGREAAPPPSGAFAFRLLPKKTRAGAGAGEAPAESEIPDRVTVDFDALPEQYRPLVRTYFELLAQRRGAPTDAPPTPERSRTP